jgi:hypothetical protein
MSHECTHIKRIDKLESAMYGKGGVLEMVVKLDTTMNNLSENIKNQAEVQKDQTTTQRALLQFMNEEKGKDKAEETAKSNSKWLKVIFTTIVLSLVGIIITLIIN